MLKKRPFYEVISEELAADSSGNKPRQQSHVSVKSARIRLSLTILQESEMPAEAAHSIERTHHNLPGIMRNWEFDDLAELAAKILKDLRTR